MKKQTLLPLFCSKKRRIQEAITILLHSLASQKDYQYTAMRRDLQSEKVLLQQKQHLFAPPNMALFQQNAVSLLLQQCCYEKGMRAELWILQEQYLHCIAHQGQPLFPSPLHNSDHLWRSYFCSTANQAPFPQTPPFPFAWLPLQNNQEVLVLSYEAPHHFRTSERTMLRQVALFFAEHWHLHLTIQDLQRQRITTHEQLEYLAQSLIDIQRLLQQGEQRESPILSAAFELLSPQHSPVEQQILDILKQL